MERRPLNDVKEFHREKMSSLGNNIKSFRQLHNLTQNELAFYIGAAPSTIYTIETDPDSNPTLCTIFKIAEVLKTNVCELLKQR